MRYFREIGYYTSYNCAGEYYTLSTIPIFDENGLWKYKSAYFSSQGSLRDTATVLVKKSKCGYTHDELRKILGIEMYHTLLDLVNDGLINREEIGGEFVYVSRDQGEAQISERRGMPPKTREKQGCRRASSATQHRAVRLQPVYIGGGDGCGMPDLRGIHARCQDVAEAYPDNGFWAGRHNGTAQMVPKRLPGRWGTIDTYSQRTSFAHGQARMQYWI
jgi:hypothetical protein